MAKIRDYIVSFDKAVEYEMDGNKYVEVHMGTSSTFGRNHHFISAESLTELKLKVEQVANSVRGDEAVAAYVRLARSNERKPSGFDAAVRRLYYGLEA